MHPACRQRLDLEIFKLTAHSFPMLSASGTTMRIRTSTSAKISMPILFGICRWVKAVRSWEMSVEWLMYLLVDGSYRAFSAGIQVCLLAFLPLTMGSGPPTGMSSQIPLLQLQYTPVLTSQPMLLRSFLAVATLTKSIRASAMLTLGKPVHGIICDSQDTLTSTWDSPSPSECHGTSLINCSFVGTFST